MKKLLLAATLAATAGTAQAATINFGPSSAGGWGPTINFNGLTAPATIVGDATITFSVQGDLDWSGEYVDVNLDGFSLGRVFDNNTGNDPFNVPGDAGSYSLRTATATIANTDFAGLIADGLLNLSFNFNAYVNCCGTVRTLYGSISYEEAAPVPLPATAGLLGLGLAGFGAIRRRKGSKKPA